MIKYFQTGYVWVNTGNHRKVTRLFLDSGSERSYISQYAIDSLGLKPSGYVYLAVRTIGGQVSEYSRYNTYEMRLQSRFNDRETINFVATGIPVIAEGTFPSSEDEWSVAPLADTAKGVARNEVDILIGQNFLAQVHVGEELVFEKKIVATNTVFGWVVAGIWPSTSETQQELPVLLASNYYEADTSLQGNKVLSLTTLSSALDKQNNSTQSKNSKRATNYSSSIENTDLKSDLEFLWSTEILGIESSLLESDSSPEA